MITDPAQVEALIQSTASLIEEDGMVVELLRSVWEETASGGIRRGTSVLQDPARRFFGAVTADPYRLLREEGEQIVLRHVLIGMPGDDIQEKDTFEVGGRQFEIVDVAPDKTWETRGWCVERA